MKDTGAMRNLSCNYIHVTEPLMNNACCPDLLSPLPDVTATYQLVTTVNASGLSNTKSPGIIEYLFFLIFPYFFCMIPTLDVVVFITHQQKIRH